MTLENGKVDGAMTTTDKPQAEQTAAEQAKLEYGGFTYAASANLKELGTQASTERTLALSSVALAQATLAQAAATRLLAANTLRAAQAQIEAQKATAAAQVKFQAEALSAVVKTLAEIVAADGLSSLLAGLPGGLPEPRRCERVLLAGDSAALQCRIVDRGEHVTHVTEDGREWTSAPRERCGARYFDGDASVRVQCALRARHQVLHHVAADGSTWADES